MASPCFDIAASGSIRITAIDPVLFMRLRDLIDIFAEEAGDRAVMPSEFLRLLDNRLMRTVQQLHADKKVHGDISPDNIVLTHYSGCSLLHPVSAPDLLPFTAFNTPFGEGLGPEHDIFAVGCVLYTVATNGLSAFAGDTVAELRTSMSKGLPLLPEHIPRDVADLIRSRISVGFSAALYGPHIFQTTANVHTTSVPSPHHATNTSEVSMEELLAALDDEDPSLNATTQTTHELRISSVRPEQAKPARVRSRSPPMPSQRVSPLDKLRSHTVEVANSNRVSHTLEEVTGADDELTTGKAGMEGVPKAKRGITANVHDHYVSPVLAKKLAAAAKVDADKAAALMSDASSGRPPDEYELALAAARAEAYNARLALVNKHSQHVNPLAPAVRSPTPQSESSASLSVRSDIVEPVTHARPLPSRSIAARDLAQAAAHEASLDKARREYFEARLALQPRHATDRSGYDMHNSSVHSPHVQGEELRAKRSTMPRSPSSPPERSHASSQSLATPARELPTSMTPSMTPQQLRTARLAAEQQAYEESLAAARRQAFEDRLALQSRYGRGV